MKTRTKNKVGKAAGLALAAAMLLTAVPATGVVRAGAYGKSEEVIKENDNVLTSNLIKDGSFEGVVVNGAKAGAWDIDITSSTAGKGGSVAIVNDGYDGDSAFQLHAEGILSGYPEISQSITVLPNTTYYVSMRVRTSYMGNIFFGIASAEREGETIYGQMHRWKEVGADLDHNAANDAIELPNPADDTDFDEYTAYSLYSAHFTTGNETACRLFIRVEQATVVIDDVSVTYEGNFLPSGSENLLRNGGFEESSKAEPLAGGWEKISDTAAAGSEIGVDSLDLSKYMRSTQDKQMEGVNQLYLTAKAGFTTDDNITVGQPVAVKSNTNYSFSVNLSKLADAKRAADEESGVTAQGIQRVTVGVYAADKETVLAKRVVDGADISMTRYTMFGIKANSGENETVYPFVKFESAEGGQWGNCLFIDDCLFFENKLDIPEGKTNLINNGDFAEGEKGMDGWYNANGYFNANDKPYASANNAGAQLWYPYGGILQDVELEAGKYYKTTAYVGGWTPQPYPAVILVMNGNAKNNNKIMSEAQTLWNSADTEGAYEKYGELGEVVARQATYVESDNFYRPMTLIFTVESTGKYTIFVGFDHAANEGDDGNLIWGGCDIGGVAMYETSMEELSPEKDTEPADVLGALDNKNVSFGKSSITVANGMPVSYFTENVYAYGEFKIKVVDADGNTVTDGNMQEGYKIVIYAEGSEADGTEFAVSLSGKNFSDPNGDDKNDDDDNNTDGGKNGWVLPVALSIAGVVVVAGVVVAIVLIKKKKGKNENNGKDD